MPKLTVNDVDSRLNGEYGCQLDDLTSRELHLIRQMCGIAPTGIVGGLLAQDAGLTVALATVVLEREGKTVNVEALWDAPHGILVFDFTDVGDESPQEQPPSGGSEHENDDASANAQISSGGASTTSSENQGGDPEATGEPG